MIKVTDISNARFRAPDLDKMEKYLTDFGMVKSASDNNSLYMRGTGPDFAVHITDLGEPGFVGMAFDAESKEDIQQLSEQTGKPVENRTEPGGGVRVRLNDPNGFAIEVTHGVEQLAPLEAREIGKINTALNKARENELLRLDAGPSKVRRLGHIAINVIDYAESYSWYHAHLGLIKSDEIYIGDESALLGAFLRCDRGAIPSDHHTLFPVGTGSVGFNHAAWEVENFDDLMLGREVMIAKGYEPVWGIGRHVLGSQIFDYWKDPWGHKVEHWTDGDLLDASIPPGLRPIDELTATQWGLPAPPEMAE
jgi:catechol 2,3-dioxygenase-like lactoylglutathione lyase family enzyme